MLSRGISPVWSADCVHRLGVRGDLQFAPQSRDEPQVVVAEREPPEGPRPARVQAARDRVELLARQPVEDLVELPAAVLRHRLERHVEHFVRARARRPAVRRPPWRPRPGRNRRTGSGSTAPAPRRRRGRSAGSGSPGARAGRSCRCRSGSSAAGRPLPSAARSPTRRWSSSISAAVHGRLGLRPGRAGRRHHRDAAAGRARGVGVRSTSCDVRGDSSTTRPVREPLRSSAAAAAAGIAARPPSSSG